MESQSLRKSGLFRPGYGSGDGYGDGSVASRNPFVNQVFSVIRAWMVQFAERNPYRRNPFVNQVFSVGR